MLHKVKASHGDILRGLPELGALLPSPDRNKKILLEMARRGEPRPEKKTKLGSALSRYINRKSDSYDSAFAKKIKTLAPHWIVQARTPATSARNKKLLLDMARRGQQKPGHKTKLGMALRGYTRKGSKTYDPDFDRKIRKLRPDWFVSSSGRNKKTLLEMAARGEPKPKQTEALGMALYSYINKKSDCHDPEFVKKIKKLAPDWLAPSSMKNKRLLLKMARSNKPKPARGTPLYTALWRYTYKKSPSHDPEFTREIRRLAPHWFKKKAL